MKRLWRASISIVLLTAAVVLRDAETYGIWPWLIFGGILFAAEALDPREYPRESPRGHLSRREDDSLDPPEFRDGFE